MDNVGAFAKKELRVLQCVGILVTIVEHIIQSQVIPILLLGLSLKGLGGHQVAVTANQIINQVVRTIVQLTFAIQAEIVMELV